MPLSCWTYSRVNQSASTRSEPITDHFGTVKIAAMTNRILLLILGLLACAILLGRWLLRRPPRYRRAVGDDLSKFFRPLLHEVYPASFLIIEVGNKDRFLQFRRYERKSEKGIQFDFPRAPWSETYYAALRKLLDEQGIEYVIDPTGQDTVVSFLTVDFQADVLKASQFATTVLRGVFGSDNRLKLYLTN